MIIWLFWFYSEPEKPIGRVLPFVDVSQLFIYAFDYTYIYIFIYTHIYCLDSKLLFFLTLFIEGGTKYESKGIMATFKVHSGLL